MGLKNIKIVFDNPWATFYCGQPVSGKVLLTIDTPKKIRGIVIHFKGEAKTKWTKIKRTTNRDGQRVNQKIHYYGHEKYFENKYNLIGGASGETTLQAGEYCYQFNSLLPLNLPSSFEGESGHVRYTVKAILDRPWKFDQETKAAFSVICPLDLNLHPTAKDPVKLTEEKFFCCCCCKSGPLTLVASLPCSGYVSGQSIPVTVEVDNISQEVISNVTVTLRKSVVFTSTYPRRATKLDKIKIGQIDLGSVGKNGSQTWTERFPIPPLPPSNLSNCSLIDVEYDLKIEGKVSGMCHQNVDLKIPLVFGTIPLASFQPPTPAGGFGDGKVPIGSGQGEMAPYNSPTAPIATGGPGEGWAMPTPGEGQPMYPTAPPIDYPTKGMPDSPPQGMDPPPSYPGTSRPPQGGSLYPDLPPPSYAEATTGAINIQDEGDSQYVQGNLDFTPRYPMYNY